MSKRKKPEVTDTFGETTKKKAAALLVEIEKNLADESQWKERQAQLRQQQDQNTKEMEVERKKIEELTEEARQIFHAQRDVRHRLNDIKWLKIVKEPKSVENVRELMKLQWSESNTTYGKKWAKVFRKDDRALLKVDNQGNLKQLGESFPSCFNLYDYPSSLWDAMLHFRR